MLHASASGRSTFHGGTGRVPPAHDPKQTTGDDATGRGGVSGAGMPLLPATPMPSPATDPFRRNCPDHIPRTTLSCPHRPNSSPELHFPSHIPRTTSLSHISRATSPSHISRAHLPNYIPRTTKERYPVKTPKLKPPSKTPCLTFHQRPQIPSRLRILNAPSSIPRTDVGSRCERTSNSAAKGHREPSNDPPPLFHTPSTFRQALPPIVPENRTSDHSTLLQRWMRPLRRCPAATSSQRYGGRLLPHSIFRIFDRR